ETGAGRTAGADAGFAVSDEVRPVAAGADRGCVSVLLSVSSARDEDLSCAFVNGVCRSRLRNRRHVSELCSGAAVPVVTAGFAPNALLVSTSSCPVTASPLRTW